MPNHYTNVIMVFPYGDVCASDIITKLAALNWAEKPLNRVLPMPKALEGSVSPRDEPNDWYTWKRANHGTKWDAYSVAQPVELPGDVGAVQITFETAWCAPCENALNAIVRELQTVYGAGRVVWLGLDPCDDTFDLVGQWDPPVSL